MPKLNKFSPARLTPKQKEFCEQYLLDRNATQAAIRAGYTKPTADRQGSRLLGYAEVIKYIAERTQKHMEKLEVSQETVLRMYAAIILHDPRKVKNPDGTTKPITAWGDAEAFALGGFEDEETTKGRGKDKTMVRTKKVKFLDRRSALADIAKMGGYDVPPPAAPAPPEDMGGRIELPFDLSKFSDEELVILSKGMRK